MVFSSVCDGSVEGVTAIGDGVFPCHLPIAVVSLGITGHFHGRDSNLLVTEGSEQFFDVVVSGEAWQCAVAAVDVELVSRPAFAGGKDRL